MRHHVIRRYRQHWQRKLALIRRCYDYLFDTLAGIKKYGIHDGDGETGKCRVSEACINRIIWVGTNVLLGIAAVAEW